MNIDDMMSHMTPKNKYPRRFRLALHMSALSTLFAFVARCDWAGNLLGCSRGQEIGLTLVPLEDEGSRFFANHHFRFGNIVPSLTRIGPEDGKNRRTFVRPDFGCQVQGLLA